MATVSSRRLHHNTTKAQPSPNGDEASPTSKAKPKGVQACEIWEKIGGEAPADLSECSFLAADSRSPYVARFSGADAGKNVYYIGRWVNTRGEHGPLSETVMATA